MTWRRRTDWSTLWLPLEARGPTWLATVVVAVYYLATMCRDLWFYDSAELAIVAFQGGLSHPPGHPLHTLLGYLFAHLPGVTPLLGLNALSALPAALGIVPLTSLAESMSGPAEPGAPRWLDQRMVLPVVIATVGLHPSLWENATRIEVYALATFFSLWAIAHMAGCLAVEESSQRPVRWIFAGLALGLSASVNPVVAALAALAVAPALLVALVRKRVQVWAVPWALAGGLSGLLPYAYILLVGEREDVMVWGGPLRGELLQRYLTGADFARNLGTSWATVGHNSVELLLWLAQNGLAPIIVLGLSAHVLWGKRGGLGRGLALLSLLGTAYFLVMNVVFFPEVSDYQGYLSTSFWLCAAGLAVMLVRLRVSRQKGPLLTGALALVVLSSVLFAPPPIHLRTRYRDRVARLLAQGALERAPRDALIIVASDHWVFPLMYLQEVEGRRPDVVVLARGLSGASWHWNRIYRQHRDLTEFPLRGPGGQPARIHRFRAANPDRPVLYESWTLAEGIGHPGCAGRWMLWDRDFCPIDDDGGGIADELTPALERASSALGFGAPTAGRVVSAVSLQRGEDLWRLGRGGEALRALRAGVPPGVRPPLSQVALSDVPPLSGPTPAWGDELAIGHYSRNLFLAGHLLWAAGARDDARAHGSAAAAAGLALAAPED